MDGAYRERGLDLPPHLIPEAGPDDPVFARLDPEDTLHATLFFAVPLSDAALDRAQALTVDWFAHGGWGDGQLEDETLTPTCLHLALKGVTAPSSAIRGLVFAFAREGLALHQLLLGRTGPNKMRSTLLALMAPEAPRQARYDDEASWWDACFDPHRAPPLSEDQGELFTDENALIEGKHTTFAEQRGLPLHVPDMRICYGVSDFAFVEADTRAADVTRALRAALDARFGGMWREPFVDPRAVTPSPGESSPAWRPAPYNLRGERDGVVDRIQRGSRVGYSCLFTTRDLRAFLYGNAFRYREYELMLALRDVVRAMDLEPVLCWRRFPRRYVVQLWERAQTRVHFAA